MKTKRLLLAGCAVIATACSTTTENDGSRPQNELSFLQLGVNTPTLVATNASFWAKRGENRELRLYYRPRAGRTDSTEYLRFRVRQRSLLRRPDGTAFANGDSVQITIRITDPQKLIVEFLPSGLVFDPSEPAELKLSFKEKGGDLNDDGSVNAADSEIKARVNIWRQESAGLPWFRLTSTVLVSSDEIEAFLNGFTSYAVAY